MHSFFTEFLERIDFLHAELHATLDRLPDDSLDWSPAPHMNSIAILLMHLTGAEQFWVGHAAVGDTTDRVRDEEFAAEGHTVTQLKARLTASQQYIHKTVATLDVADLAQERAVIGYDRTFTVAWSLLHALEHSATHVGHIHMMADVWKLQQNV